MVKLSEGKCHKISSGDSLRAHRGNCDDAEIDESLSEKKFETFSANIEV